MSDSPATVVAYPCRPAFVRRQAAGAFDDALSWDQLRPLTIFATAESDQFWARKAPDLRPATLVREAERHRRLEAAHAEDVRLLRYFTMRWDAETTHGVGLGLFVGLRPVT